MRVEEAVLSDGRRAARYSSGPAPAEPFGRDDGGISPQSRPNAGAGGVRERRRDPLTGEWRVVASPRQDRTFLPPAELCPLCPTVEGGPATEVPWPSFEVAVFDNRFPSLVAGATGPVGDGPVLFETAPAVGACEVVVYSDDHTASLGSLGVERARLLVDVWAERTAALGARPEVAYVYVFENRGEAVGVTLHHPHGQVYAFPDVPPRPALELARAQSRCPLCPVVAAEAHGPRLVAATGGFVAHVPFAPRLPYEVHVAARRHVGSLAGLDDAERDDLAAALVDVVRRYDALFGFPLPYVMAVHQAPTDGGDWSEAGHLHVEFMPLHRSADRLKHLAGTELGAGAFLVDVAPEDAAAALRACR